MITLDTTLEELADVRADARALASGDEGNLVALAADRLVAELNSFTVARYDKLNRQIVLINEARGYFAQAKTDVTPAYVVDLILRRLSQLHNVDDLIGNAQDAPWDGEFYTIADLFGFFGVDADGEFYTIADLFGFFGVDADLLPDLLDDISDERVRFVARSFTTGQTLIEVLITASLPTRFGYTPTHTRRELIGWR